MANVPAFAATPKRGGCVWLNGSTADTTNDGTGTIGTDLLLAYTAGASGAYIDRIRLLPVSVTAATATATTATVARIFLSTATSGAVTSANTRLWQEVACPAQTTGGGTAACTPIDIPMGIRLPANETILFSMYHVAVANTGWECTVIASDY